MHPPVSVCENLLEIRKADIYRGQSKIFDQFSLRIKAGQSTAIVGPNGAGKSTLLKLMGREIYATGGTVEIFGRERWNIWDLKQRLGIVSDDLQRNYSPSALGRSVVLSGFYSSVDTFGHQTFTKQQLAIATRVSNELGIQNLNQTPFSKMSTGEQRRHLLARALVNDPETLVLDEPTTGLDLAAQFAYLDTIRGLIKQHKTVILVTHHIHEIPPEIDQIILLDNGQVKLSALKEVALTDENLSQLFGVNVRVVSENGFHQVVPG